MNFLEYWFMALGEFLTIFGLRLYISATVTQHSDNVSIIASYCPVNGHLAIVVRNVDVSAAVEQRTRHLSVTLKGTQVQWRFACAS